MAISSKNLDETVITEKKVSEVTTQVAVKNELAITDRDVKLVDDSLTGNIDTQDKATIQVLQSQINEYKIKVNDLENQVGSAESKLRIQSDLAANLQNQLTNFVSNNFAIDTQLQKLLNENTQLKTEIQNLKNSNSQLLDQLSLYQSPYGHELEVLSNLNNLYSNQLLQISTLNSLIKKLRLNENLDLLISNIQLYIVDKILNEISTKFETLQLKIEHQNQIENSKFDINEQTLGSINTDNINIYLINGTDIKQLTNKNISVDDNGISFLEIPEEDLSKNGEYILYFTNSNYIFKDILVRQYSLSNSLDIILFRDIQSISAKGQKIRFKNENDKIIQENIIYDDIQFGQWKVLVTDKIRNSFSRCDILNYEIDDFYMHLKLTNTDIDIIQQLLIGKMIYDKKASTRTFFDIDDQTILIILRTYLDPNNNTETRIETLT